jgi:N utilization substance protein A
LRGEKIDIIPYNDEPARFVAKALSPARVREVLVDDETKEATVIVPDDQLSLAIGRDGQNARLAARLTGWKVDITSETEFAQQEEDIEYEGEEAADGRCMAIMTTGRRCPNAGLQGSQYCGLPQHQALARFSTNQVAVLGPLSDEEVTTLADSNADAAAVKPIVEKAESQFDESAGTEEAEADEVEEVEEAGEAEEAEADGDAPESEENVEAEVDATPEAGSEDGGEPEAEAPSEDGGKPEAEEQPAPTAATNTAAGSSEEQKSE